MATALVVVLLACFCHASAQTGPEYNVSLSVDPPEISAHLTTQLTIECNVTAALNSTDAMYPMSLRILRASMRQPANFTPIAFINIASRHIEQGYDQNATIDGHWMPMDHTKTNVHVHWSYPQFQMSGTYMCELAALDMTGGVVKINVTQRVMDKTATRDDWLKKIEVHDRQIQALLAERNSGMMIRQELRESLFFHVQQLASANNHTYLVSRPLMQNAAVADSLCRVVGGRLLEYDQREYLMLGKFFSDMDTTTIIGKNAKSMMVGATDEKQEGIWVNRVTNQRIAFDNWAAGGATPPSDTNKNCAALTRASGWKLEPVSCYDNTAFVNFICEIEP